jgi:hypothetical protein
MNKVLQSMRDVAFVAIWSIGSLKQARFNRSFN